MRYFISAMFLLASAAHAVEANTSSINVDSGSPGTCKVAISNVGESMPDGAYQGECVGGKPHGAGLMGFINGDRFKGTFKDGRIDGKGTGVSGSGGNSDIGHWRNGKREGTGTYNWAGSSQQYVGEWADDKRNGKGTLKWGNGDRFEGEFRDNRQYTGTYFTGTGATHTCYMG